MYVFWKRWTLTSDGKLWVFFGRLFQPVTCEPKLCTLFVDCVSQHVIPNNVCYLKAVSTTQRPVNSNSVLYVWKCQADGDIWPQIFLQQFDYADLCQAGPLLSDQALAAQRAAAGQSPGQGSTGGRSRPWHDFGRQNDADKIQIPKLWVLHMKQSKATIASHYATRCLHSLTAVTPNLRSRPNQGRGGFWRRVTRGFDGELYNYEEN